MLKNISLLLSAVFSPLIIPTYGIILALWSSVLNNMPFDVKMSVVMMVAAMTFLLPVIVLWLMQRVGYISGFALVSGFAVLELVLPVEPPFRAAALWTASP